MAYDPCFDSEENKTLLAICTRKLISKIGLAGVAWGAIAIIGGADGPTAIFLSSPRR